MNADRRAEIGITLGQESGPLPLPPFINRYDLKNIVENALVGGGVGVVAASAGLILGTMGVVIPHLDNPHYFDIPATQRFLVQTWAYATSVFGFTGAAAGAVIRPFK